MISVLAKRHSRSSHRLFLFVCFLCLLSVFALTKFIFSDGRISVENIERAARKLCARLSRCRVEIIYRGLFSSVNNLVRRKVGGAGRWRLLFGRRPSPYCCIALPDLTTRKKEAVAEFPIRVAQPQEPARAPLRRFPLAKNRSLFSLHQFRALRADQKKRRALNSTSTSSFLAMSASGVTRPHAIRAARALALNAQVTSDQKASTIIAGPK